ncbi:hypothetical protein ABID22_001847 [Pontibacter aydingkolensis]|uniref:DUF4397 domain-containing protein n=1 Tax=Pontibacter aydingkolensis TaxID=1911536 RepID=A0ABS7CPM6_9BACT|nr:DUF4397 domain-containing protein [Pontibacter aydingkolensis]MBW7465769.1 DUF4397 domain-containing protein [Pontibacter aydingkolensis]
MKKNLRILLLAILPTMFLAACDDDDDLDLLEDNAQVMVIHASPDAPAVDLYVDDAKVNTSALNYPGNTGYLDVEEGTRNFKVTPAGAGVGSAVINANVPLEEDQAYSVFAINTVSNIEALVLEDDLTEPASNMAHVRFVHLSPDAPAVDIAVQNGPVLFSNIAFKGSTAFTPVTAGTYTLEVRPSGSTTAVLTPLVQLSSGVIYTIFAKGFLTPPANNNNTLGAEVIINN